MIRFEEATICGRVVSLVYVAPSCAKVADDVVLQFLEQLKREDSIDLESGRWLVGVDFGWKRDSKKSQNPIRFVHLGSMRRALVVDLCKLQYRMPQELYRFLRDPDQRLEYGLVGCHLSVADDRKLFRDHGFALFGTEGVWDVGTLAVERGWGHSNLFSISQRLFREPLDKTARRATLVSTFAYRGAQDAVVARWAWEHMNADEPDEASPEPFLRPREQNPVAVSSALGNPFVRSSGAETRCEETSDAFDDEISLSDVADDSPIPTGDPQLANAETTTSFPIADEPIDREENLSSTDVGRLESSKTASFAEDVELPPTVPSVQKVFRTSAAESIRLETSLTGKRANPATKAKPSLFRAVGFSFKSAKRLVSIFKRRASDAIKT